MALVSSLASAEQVSSGTMTITGALGEAVVQVNGTYAVPEGRTPKGIPIPGIPAKYTVKRPPPVSVRYQGRYGDVLHADAVGIRVKALTAPNEAMTARYSYTHSGINGGLLTSNFDATNLVDPTSSLGYTDANYGDVCTGKPAGTKVPFGGAKAARATSGVEVMTVFPHNGASHFESIDPTYVPLFVLCNLTKPQPPMLQRSPQ